MMDHQTYEDIMRSWNRYSLARIHEALAAKQTSSAAAEASMDADEQPTEDERKLYCSEDEAHNYNFKGLVAVDAELEYVPVPEDLFHTMSRNAWLPPTPSGVQRVIEVISECWRYVHSLGKMPLYKEPENISDERVDEIMKALNEVLFSEFGAWGTAAGYTSGATFPADLTTEDKRTIVALIQEAVYKYNVRELLAGANSSGVYDE